MKTVCDVLGVALCFGREKNPFTRRAGRSPHQAYRRLGVGHPIQDRAAKQSLQVCAGVSALCVLTEWTDTIHMPEATPLTGMALRSLHPCDFAPKSAREDLGA